MGSTSVGAGWAGASISFGTTWRDGSCTRRLDSRQVQAIGNIPVAMEVMCDAELVRAAAQRAGRPCVVDGGVPFVPVVAGQTATLVEPEPVVHVDRVRE